jgi:phosphatidylinositol glycan class B
MAIPLAGLFLWLIFIRKEKISHLLYLISGGVVVLIACFLLDSWYYGNWVSAPWNYFKSNMIDGIASHFGVSPWYFYLDTILSRSTPLIGLIILLALTVFLVRKYRNPIAWCIVPYLLVHTLIPHKELRFLFPVAFFLPFILVFTWQEIPEKWTTGIIKQAILYPILAVALIINAGGLVILAFKPASNGNMAMLQYLHNHYNQVTLYTIAGSNPYTLGKIKGLTPLFYANNKVRIKNLADVLNSKSQEKLNDEDLVMLRASYSERIYLEKLGFTEKYRSIPLWIEMMDRFYKVLGNYNTVFVLYSKKNE